MKGRFALRTRAQADVDEIWDYTADRWDLEQAEVYVRPLSESIQTIADSPYLGRECNEVRAGYLKYASGSHVIFYRVTKDGLDIVRILHERMDHARHIP